MNGNEDVSVLNTLITTTIDSAIGFEKSAEEIEQSRFAAEFQRYAQERRQVVEALQAEVRRLGGTPEDDGSVMGAAHHRWVAFKNALMGGDDQAVLTELRNGETYLRSKYDTALQNENLSEQTRSVISAAYESVRTGHDRAVSLLEATKSNTE